MQRSRVLWSWVLLATIVAGGVLGPSLHRIQHAREQAAASDHVHAATDGPIWCGEPVRANDLDCALCASRLLVVPPSPVPPTPPAVTAHALVPTPARSMATTAAAHHHIRGPPAARLSVWV